MKIAILDDEIHCIESLVIHINSLFPHATIVYKSNRVEYALEKLPKIDIDLLFLDIEMPGMNGFQVLDQLPDRKFDVIFTTAYSQYAVDAFKIKAVNYLLKPIDERELKLAVEDWENMKDEQGKDQLKVNDFIDALKTDGILQSKIAIPVADGYEFIEINKIMYCRSQSNYCEIIMSGGAIVMVSKTLKEVEAVLSKYLFIRPHQSFLINPNFLKKYYRRGGNYVVMDDNQKIPVSNHKRELITSIFEAVSKNNE